MRKMTVPLAFAATAVLIMVAVMLTMSSPGSFYAQARPTSSYADDRAAIDVITDGVSVGVGDAEPENSKMTRIPETDVWYRTYDVRNDARFTYSLSENDPLALFTNPNRKSNSKPDPLIPPNSGI